MTETTRSEAVKPMRLMLSKVPEVTVWFWIIKILCTTVGESFADWINMTLGVGLMRHALIFTVVLVAVLAWQLRLDRYVPFVYWLTVVVVSVTGHPLYRHPHRQLGVPLALSTSRLRRGAGAWFSASGMRANARSRSTASSRCPESCSTGSRFWSPSPSALRLATGHSNSPAGDLASRCCYPPASSSAIVIGWRLGANAVLSFWLAYILTRPLGANLGDWFGLPKDQQGLGLGVAVTSVDLSHRDPRHSRSTSSITHTDVIEQPDETATTKNPVREPIMLGYYAVLAVATGALLVWAADQPHTTAAASENESGGASVAATLAPGQSATAKFPPPDVAKFRTITQDTLAKVQAGDQTGAKARITDLETAWDDGQQNLEPMDETGWTVLDGQIDSALKAVRSGQPDPATEQQALTTLLASLQ